MKLGEGRRPDSDMSGYFPPAGPGDWERTSAAAAGWDAAALEEAVRYCGECRSHQLVLLDHGRVLAEQYWSGARPSAAQDVASVQKSVVWLLLAILAETGTLRLDDPATRWLGRGWSRADPAQEDAIALRHLATMTSGLYDDFTFEESPGTVWYYHNNAYHQLRKVIEAATGLPTSQVFDRCLSRRLGLNGSRWAERPGSADPNGWALSGLFSTARDLARIGLLVMSGGRWKRDELLGDGSLSAALRPSQPLNPSYGHLWWLPTEPAAVLPGAAVTDPRKSSGGYRLDRPVIPAAPPGLVAGFGAGVQRLYVSRALNVVAVRLGAAPPRDRLGLQFDEGFWQRLMAAAPSARTAGLR